MRHAASFHHPFQKSKRTLAFGHIFMMGIFKKTNSRISRLFSIERDSAHLHKSQVFFGSMMMWL